MVVSQVTELNIKENLRQNQSPVSCTTPKFLRVQALESTQLSDIFHFYIHFAGECAVI